MQRQPAVYIPASRRNGTLYVGVTSNLVRRVWEHRNGLGDGFTKRYRVHRLVYFELIDSMEAAIVISILLYLLSAAGYLAYFLLQKNYLQRAGIFALLGGFIFHTAALVLDGVQQGQLGRADAGGPQGVTGSALEALIRRGRA